MLSQYRHGPGRCVFAALLVFAPLSAALAAAAANDLSATRSNSHLAGYAFVNYVSPEHGDGAFTQAGFNPIFHYLYDDRVLVEAEVEFELGDEGETELEFEYASIDLFLSDTTVLVAGKFLSPLGNFRQNLHPAWINRFASAPVGFGHDGAAPISDLGVQLRGVWPDAGLLGRITYALALTNGPTLEAEDGELEGVLAEGSTATATGTPLVGGRLGLIPVAWMDIGLSYATGRTRVTEDESGEVEDDPARDYRFYGADFVCRPLKPLEFRGEYARQHADAAVASLAPDEADWTAWYLQGAWRAAALPVEAVVRYGRFDAAVDDLSQKQLGLGVNWWLTASTVLKAGYEFNDALATGVDIGDRALLQVAHGF